MNLSTNLDQIKGVGPKTAEQLAKAGLVTVGDLLMFLPRKHEDFTGVTLINQIQPGKVTIKARCESISTRHVRRGMQLTSAVLADDSGKLNAVWFNQGYRVQQLGGTSDEFYFSGTFEYNYNKYQLTNPSAEHVKDFGAIQGDRLLPVYHAAAGLKSNVLRKIYAILRPLMTVLPETLPESVINEQKLMNRSQAVTAMHFPEKMEDVTRARERLGFEELFEMLVASQLNKQQNQKLTGIAMPFDQAAVKDFVSNLPFALTNAQRRAAWQIIQDFESAVPMNRLLQGDVGSGKTVVAALAARQAAVVGYQTAIMAPTEILARQHASTLANLLEPFGVTVGLLIGGVKGKARELVYNGVKNGSIAVAVGTHALIQEAVEFHNLGFVVIDEQHRFGVEQRQKLLNKAHKMPHLLAMTATPIPRSLALTLYGELEVSILDEKPANRKPIITKTVNPVSAAKVYEHIDEQITKGRQAYIICSLIDENPNNDLKSVQAELKKLKNSVFSHRNIALLHGKMKPSEKDQVMQDFKDKKYDILVSTTVVEVGVDVPNATLIMIENADRFGLSQLHQLRGRVGRSDLQSYCYLMMSNSKKPTERLREIEKSNDGFYLAEADLKLRGPGEIYGKMQHGALNLQIATLGDTKLIKRASDAAKAFVTSGEDLLNYKQLAEQVRYYQRLTTLN